MALENSKGLNGRHFDGFAATMADATAYFVRVSFFLHFKGDAVNHPWSVSKSALRQHPLIGESVIVCQVSL